MSSLVDIIIPTFDNTSQLSDCMRSILATREAETAFHIYVVNNGHPDSCNWIDPKHRFITVVQTGGQNLGWEGGLLKGLEVSTAPFVIFANDDIVVPLSAKRWMGAMFDWFKDPQVGAVGPCSNMVMGFQNMLAFTEVPVFTSTFLIGFFMMVRRSALEEVGGVDDSLPGGDDLDLSIRLRDAGYKLVVDKNVFVFHYGSQTGNRLFGDHRQTGGWNSPMFTDKVNDGLIRKHGFRKWWETLRGAYMLPSMSYNFKPDSEGKLIRKKVKAKGLKVVDVGCGDLKTWPHAIGVDIIPKGERVVQIRGDALSSADIAADVSQPLPFPDDSVDVVVARHILEHMMDPIAAVRNWVKIIKPGGRLVISVPNEHLIQCIPMNPEHVHAWTPESMRTFMDTLGLKIIDMWDSQNSISFTTVVEKGSR